MAGPNARTRYLLNLSSFLGGGLRWKHPVLTSRFGVEGVKQSYRWHPAAAKFS